MYTISLPPPPSPLSQTLEKVSAGYKASYQEAEAQYNADKNRFPDKLPSECPAMCVCVFMSMYTDAFPARVRKPWSCWWGRIDGLFKHTLPCLCCCYNTSQHGISAVVCSQHCVHCVIVCVEAVYALRALRRKIKTKTSISTAGGIHCYCKTVCN